MPPDDDPAGLPPRAERTWRHPSELGPNRPVVAPVGAGRRSHAATAVVAAITGAVVATAVLALVGTLRPRVVETTRPATTSTAVAEVRSERPVMGVAQSIDSVAPSVWQVEAAGRMGSAVVVGADGVLVTSADLVGGADDVAVTGPDGGPQSAEVVGVDPVSGVAVLRVDRPNLPAVDLTESRPQPGDRMVALAGESQVMVGWVSALGQQVDGPSGPRHDLVTTDRPVPAGGDGGVLIDSRGRVAGLLLGLTGAAGLGYAIPADTVRSVADQLLADGHASHPWLGFEPVDLPGGQAADLGVAGGVVADGVDGQGPAAAAGLRPGDVVVTIEGESVGSPGEMWSAMADHRPGDRVTLAWLRDGRRVQATVTLGQLGQ